jgi:hypothetical protein
MRRSINNQERKDSIPMKTKTRLSLQALQARRAPLLMALLLLAVVLGPNIWRGRANQEDLPGEPGIATLSAVVSFSELAAQEALSPAEGPVEPVSIQPPKELPDNLTLPPGAETALESVQRAAAATETERSGARVTSLASAASPAPAIGFQGLDDGLAVIPPDTMGAVGPDHVVTTLNDRIRFQTRTGAIIATISNASFWASLGNPSVFDPRINYDQYQQRWIFSEVSNSFSAASSLLIGVSQTSDPTGGWNLYRIDADAANVVWADFPMMGFNKDWVVIQVNMFTNATGTFSRPNIYVFNKADLYAGGAGAFTLFQGNNTGQPFAITGGSWAPAATYDETLGTLYLIQNWNSTSGLIRVSKISGPVGAEVITPGITFPAAPNAWVNATPLLNGGFAPQAGVTLGSPFATRITTNDARMQNVVYRNGSLWAAHTVHLTTTPLAIGTVQSAANPVNHAGAQWWETDSTIENNNVSLPLQRGLIQDPTADNCHNGTGGLKAGCVQRGTFYAFPSIAANKLDDVLIGYSIFSPEIWASSGYSFRAGGDPLNTLRDPALLKAGEARYGLAANGNVRWGDYSATMTDPVNDCDFWTIQEYADTRINSDARSRWATWWGKVVADLTPPAIDDVAVDKPVLSPPNHKMHRVTVDYTATDDCCGDLTCVLSVTSNEPDNGTGDGDTSVDSVVLDAHHVLLRAERSGGGSGRIYTITITCTDRAGNVSTRTAQVLVNHDKGK